MQVHSFPVCHCFFSERCIQPISKDQIIPVVLSILGILSLVVTLIGLCSYLPSTAKWISFSSFFFFSVSSTILLCRTRKEKTGLQKLKTGLQKLELPLPKEEKSAKDLLFKALQDGDTVTILVLLTQKRAEYKPIILEIMQFAFKVRCEDKILKWLLRFSSSDVTTFGPEKDIFQNLGLSAQEFEKKAPLSHFAAAHGYLGAISLLNLCGKLDLTEEWMGHTPLYYSVLQENAHFIKVVLSLFKGQLNNKAGASLLKLAVLQSTTSLRSYAVIEALVESNEEVRVPIDLPDEEGVTALHWAAREKDIMAAEILKKFHADPYIKAKDGSTFFTSCAKHGKEFESILFFDHKFQWKGADCSFSNWECDQKKEAIKPFKDLFPTYGSAYLAYAASINDFEVVSELLKLGVSPNVQGNNGWTPIHYAASKGHREVIECLIKAGAKLLLNNVGENPLWVASPKGLKAIFECVTLLSPHETKEWNLSGLLFMAAERPDFKEFVEKLIQLGADVNNQANTHKLSPIHVAVTANNTEFIRILSKHKANLDLVSENKETALYCALKNGNDNVFQVLLECGADPNIKINGRPLLNRACFLSKINMATLLLNAESVDLTAVDEDADADKKYFYQLIEDDETEWTTMISQLPEKTKAKVLQAFDVKSNLEADNLIDEIDPFLIAVAASAPDLEKLMHESFHLLHQPNLEWVLQTWNKIYEHDKLFQILSSSPALFLQAFPTLSDEMKEAFLDEFQSFVLKDFEEYSKSNVEKRLRELQERISLSPTVSLEDRQELLKIRAHLDRLHAVCKSIFKKDMAGEESSEAEDSEEEEMKVEERLDKTFLETLDLYREALMVTLKETVIPLLKEVEKKSPKIDFLELADGDSLVYLGEILIKDTVDDKNLEIYQKDLGVSAPEIYQRGIQEVRDIQLLGLSGKFGFLIQKARDAIKSESSLIKEACDAILEWKTQELTVLENLEGILKKTNVDVGPLSTFIKKLKECDDKCKSPNKETFYYLKELWELDRKRRIFSLKAYLNQPNMDKIPTEILKGSSLSEYASGKNEDFTFYYHLLDSKPN